MSDTALGVLLAVLATGIEGFAQVFLKKSAMLTVGKNGWIALGLVFHVVEAVVYTAALHFLDVSVAFPIGSLSFVAVTLLSQWLLRETINRDRWIGVALILVGASLVATHA